jgi:hypothetical protein
MPTLLTRSTGLLGLLLLAVVTAAPEARAQRLGVEVGVAGVANHDPVNPTIGLSLFLPLTEHFRLVGSASQWTGCDVCEGPPSGFGNRGFNVLGLYRVVGSDAASASVGAGAGWYEMFDVRDGQSDRRFQDAITLSAEARRAVAYNSSLYLRGDLSFPIDESQPRWSFLRAGVDVGGLF